ncbi:glycosyltransferase [Salinibacter ruber]|uniref:glycosyltransferase n=1 Tax=Salinibacter ruber TaxID=146919 RepID=UPI0021698A77|nr:glycosyltransferase [Salinibacter ruber]
MRVCHYRRTFSKLSETFIYDYLMELERQDVTNHVITLERRNSEARPFPNVSRVRWPGKWDPRRLYHGIQARLGLDGSVQDSYRREARRRVATVIQQVDPDVVHAHFGREGVFIAPVAERLGIPLVVTFYGFDISQLPEQEGWVEAYSAMWEQVRAVTVLSEEMKRKARELGCPEKKLTVVHLSREVDQFPFRPPDSEVSDVLFVGRLTPKKAPLDAVRALQRANARGANLHLDMIGDGECRDEVGRYIEKHDLSDTVTLHGYLSNEEVSTHMQAADAFLLPSKTAPNGDREGTPTVLVEAQATGLPCVTTRHAGIPEMIPEENHHLLVEEGNVAALSEQLCRVAHMNVNELQTIAQNGREKIESEFSLTGEVQKLRAVYASAVSVSDLR